MESRGGKANVGFEKKRKLDHHTKKDDKPKCQFCKLRHGGSECWAMKKYMEANADSVYKKSEGKANTAKAGPTKSKAEKKKKSKKSCEEAER